MPHHLIIIIHGNYSKSQAEIVKKFFAIAIRMNI